MKRTPTKAATLSQAQIREIETTVFDLVEKRLEERFYLLAVRFEREAGHWYLRLFVECREQAISLNLCALISHEIDPLIDQLKVLQNFPYSLEVSSPGLFRPLETAREFEFYQGRPVRVEARPPAKGKKTGPTQAVKPQEGILQGFDPENNVVTLRTSESDAPFQVQLTEDLVAYLNPEVHFPEEDEDDDFLELS